MSSDSSNSTHVASAGTLDAIVSSLVPGVLAAFNPWYAVHYLLGHGTGALKQGVRQWLPSSRYVKDFRPANAEEGGDALTVVRLA